MPKFSKKSKRKLAECDRRLQKLFNEVIKHYDCSIITGYRGREEQFEKYNSGLSRARWPNSKHNSIPSMAADVYPWPIPDNWGKDDWKEKVKFYMLAAIVLYEANRMGITIRWGGDFNMDHNYRDNTFDDLGHFEIVEEGE